MHILCFVSAVAIIEIAIVDHCIVVIAIFVFYNDLFIGVFLLLLLFKFVCDYLR